MFLSDGCPWAAALVIPDGAPPGCEPRRGQDLHTIEPPPVSPARGPPTDWNELVQVHDERDVFQGRIDEVPVIDIHRL